jgi:geranylgeranyl diphosphate synthase type II
MSEVVLSSPAPPDEAKLNWKHPLQLVESRLDSILSRPLGYETSGVLQAGSLLREAMRYSVFSGGKRLRSQLVLEAANVVGSPQHSVEWALPAACAIELIHAYSLVHDDLPAMDNADTRRGRPSCHRKYGEANAILAGDALLTLAFEVLAEPIETTVPISADRSPHQLRAAALVARAAGEMGMVGGQTIDMDWSGGVDAVTGEALFQMHAMKTGALIRVSSEVGALLGGGTAEQVEALRSYGVHLGRAFQITDDILDVIGDPNQTGKAASDAANGKLTAPAIFGLETARDMAREAVESAVGTLQEFGSEADTLRALARFIHEREK